MSSARRRASRIGYDHKDGSWTLVRYGRQINRLLDEAERGDKKAIAFFASIQQFSRDPQHILVGRVACGCCGREVPKAENLRQAFFLVSGEDGAVISKICETCSSFRDEFIVGRVTKYIDGLPEDVELGDGRLHRALTEKDILPSWEIRMENGRTVTLAELAAETGQQTGAT